MEKREEQRLIKRVIRMYEKERKSIYAVARDLNMRTWTVRDLLIANGVTIRSRGPVPMKDPSKKPLSPLVETYLKLIDEGKSQTEIAEQFGVTRSAIHMVLKYHRLLGRIKPKKKKEKKAS